MYFIYVEHLQEWLQILKGSKLTTEVGNIDYSYVSSPARIALYDDMLSSPRIIDISPAETGEFIGTLSAEIYNQAQQLGGSIPYTVISQVTENFIHAAFKEMVISIFDSGNTIRFTDQGPGISDKEKAQQPGYSSATREMKNYINGVGSGLPIVREYLETKHGTIHIEDNLNSGAVVTISLVEEKPVEDNDFVVQHFHDDKMMIEPSPYDPIASYKDPYKGSIDSNRSLQLIVSSLSKREVSIIYLFKNNDVWGITDISKETGIPASSTSNLLSKLEQMGILIKVGKKRALTDLGESLLDFL